MSLGIILLQHQLQIFSKKIFFALHLELHLNLNRCLDLRRRLRAHRRLRSSRKCQQSHNRFGQPDDKNHFQTAVLKADAAKK